MEKETKRGQRRLNPHYPRLIFLGTPEFAVPSLKALVAADASIPLVITQPDRPSGRGKKLTAPAVKVAAIDLGVPVYQPERVRGAEVLEHIRSFEVDCAVVVAFGQILPRAFLDLFPLGVLNVHASLLPRYRGAAPIQRSILAGDDKTGVSIMLLDPGMDTGPVLSQASVPIAPSDDFRTVHDRLSAVGAALMAETLMDWKAGRIQPVPQEDSLATYAPPLGKDEPRIDWRRSAVEIVNRIRAFDPVPGAHCLLGSRRFKVYAASPGGDVPGGPPGEILAPTEAGLLIRAGDGRAVAVREVQMEGQRRLPVSDVLRGHASLVGSILE